MLQDLDAASPIPLYQQIVEQVRRLTALGALRPGDRFLTVRELAAKARVNRNTAARAIQELEREGIVHTRVGRGTFVVEAPARPAAEREAAIGASIDRLLVDATTLGIPLEELGWKLSKGIEAFRSTAGANERGPD